MDGVIAGIEAATSAASAIADFRMFASCASNEN
jgi:hypothetical protein